MGIKFGLGQGIRVKGQGYIKPLGSGDFTKSGSYPQSIRDFSY